MFRGISTVNLWADDLPAAVRWYTELLGAEPYFSSEAAGRGPGYVEFRIGDYETELGIIDRRFAPPGAGAAPGGAVVYWHVDDVSITLERAMSSGATQLEALTERGPGFVTASVIDPFGNVLGFMHNRHYLESSTPEPKRPEEHHRLGRAADLRGTPLRAPDLTWQTPRSSGRRGVPAPSNLT